MSSEITKIKTLNQIWLDRHYEDWQDCVRKWIQQFTPNYKQDFPSKKAVLKADAQTELISQMLRLIK